MLLVLVVLDINIGATIANNKITLHKINQIAPYVYKPCPIPWICKKLVKAVSAITGLYAVFTEDKLIISGFNKILFKLVKKSKL